MNTAEVYRGTTDQQRHGSQSEVQLRSQTPFGLLARGVQPSLGNKGTVAKAKVPAKAPIPFHGIGG